MKRVIIESPYAGDVRRNTSYARKCVRHSLLRGEAPLASHLLYTQPQIFNDNVPEEREAGISAGLSWYEVAELCAVYADYGITEGMKAAMNYAIAHNVRVEIRYILKRNT